MVFRALENALVFHPVRADQDWVPPPNEYVQDIALTLPDATRVHAWWCPVDQPAGIVLYCHGNGGNVSHRADEIVRWQEEMGCSVLIFDYPGYGRSSGRPSERACYASATAAYDWLVREIHCPVQKLLVYGSSLGGAVAVELAGRQPCMALVLNSTFTSIPDMAAHIYRWLPVRRFVYNRFDSAEKIGACKCPIFIAHGDCDATVPCEYGRQLFDLAPQPKEFYRMQGWDHNDPPPPEFYQRLRDFLNRAIPSLRSQA